MKVLFDIAVLGLGHIMPRARTGVFRVIENVAEQLALHPQCNMTFCSNTNLKTVEYAESYLRNSKSLSNIPFSKPFYFTTRLKNSSRKELLIRRILEEGPLSTFSKLQTKFGIKQLIALERMSDWYQRSLANPKDIKAADIYHSPFHPLPSDITKLKTKRTFITCYDLIPILFPHYFEQDIIDLMQNILKSITPETWVLCISNATRNDLLNYLGNKINPEQVIVTELAASDTFYQSLDKEKNLLIRRKNNIPDGKYILSLCTFEPRKNIEQVIKAFAKIIKEQHINDLHLVLVGTKGWMFDKIFQEITNSEDIKSKIVITGFVADEDLAALYSDALFFVYPSFYEGFGLPPLEAMKCGTPVITSNKSSLPEVIGDAGIMVNPTDIDALCQAMVSVYESHALRQQMSGKSLDRASRFSWERCGRETINAYAASLVV